MGSTLDQEMFANRRRLVYGKILEGWDKLAREYPQIDWQLDTPETRAAEETVCTAKEDYERGAGTLADLRAAFAGWREAHIKKKAQPGLFSVG